MTKKDGNNRRAERSEDELSFVRRWSRRKHQAQTAPTPESKSPDNHESAQDGMFDSPAETRAAKPLDDAPAEGRAEPTDADLPPLESLGENSDYRGFLSSRVSESLRRAALRKLFQSPRYNVRDGLDDYDGDYTRYTRMSDDTVTAHAKFQSERLRQRAQSNAAEQPPDTSAGADIAHSRDAALADEVEASSGGAQGDDRGHGSAEKEPSDPADRTRDR